MICKNEMLNLILKASPSFKPIWEEFLEEWKGENDLPLYLVLGDLARYIDFLVDKNNERELVSIFEVVEKWHLEGDSYVKEAATIGLLEGLQNTNQTNSKKLNKIESYLLPESKRWWNKVNEFWEKGKIISE